MKISVEKCSCTLFSLDPKHASMGEISVRIDGRELRREKSPCLLGVTFDTKLTLGEHVGGLIRKAEGRLKVLRCLAGTSWGWKKPLLRTTYTALVQSVLTYGEVAWGPWVSGRNFALLKSAR